MKCLVKYIDADEEELSVSAKDIIRKQYYRSRLYDYGFITDECGKLSEDKVEAAEFWQTISNLKDEMYAFGFSFKGYEVDSGLYIFSCCYRHSTGIIATLTFVVDSFLEEVFFQVTFSKKVSDYMVYINLNKTNGDSHFGKYYFLSEEREIVYENVISFADCNSVRLNKAVDYLFTAVDRVIDILGSGESGV